MTNTLRQLRGTLTAPLLLTLGLAACQPEPPSAPVADLLLVNARVYTLDWEEPAGDGAPASGAPYEGGSWHPDAEAVAIGDGRVLFVGGSAEAKAWRGPETRVRDLGGATVLPGLVDSHTHLQTLGANLSRVDLVGVESEEEVVAKMIAERSRAEPGSWIFGYGWDDGAWSNRYPNMDALSEAFPDHPVVLFSLHGFATWGNRAAFERAGIDADTEPPVGGTILKDAAGKPTGVLLNRAGTLLRQAIPDPSPAEAQEQFRRALAALAAAGYVTVHEAGLDAQALDALSSLDRRGELPLRVYAMLSARDETLLREWIERGPELDSTARLRVRSVKAYYDGALGSRGARLLDDYSDATGHRGSSGSDYGFAEGPVLDALGAGFQLAIHAIGDAGNREVLDFFDRAYLEHPAARTLRHRIEHAQVLAPRDLPRLAKLGIIASMQPPHAVEDKVWAEERLGRERTLGAYAWRSLRASGARLVFNSDLAGSDYDIFYGLHAAITRRDRDLEPEGGWYPQEAMTPEEALRGYTTWAAYTAFVENETGKLSPGRWADLTVMDLDPFVVGTEAPERLLEGKILMTVVEGRIIYDRASSGSAPLPES